jgi:hypothetical protein
MPFKSKAQQRWMFATNPDEARKWADETKNIKDLPEKKHPQKNRKRKKLPPMTTKNASDGMFFEKRSQPRKGRFFRDMPGREGGDFHEKNAFSSYAPGEIPSGGGIDVGTSSSTARYGAGNGKPAPTKDTNIGATGAPVGGMGQKGEGMSGGMYGTGDGDKSEETKGRESDTDRLQDLLAAAAGGKERKASEEEKTEEKTAGKTPNDWDADSGLPTGFHRPAYEQPEALEAGGERFHTTTAKNPNYSHGLVEGGKMTSRKGTGHQMGKHASAAPPVTRFMGTSFAIEKTAKMKYNPNYGDDGKSTFSRGGLGERGRELKQSGGKAVDYVARKADEGVKAVTRSPAATALAALLLGRAGYGALKGAGRLALGRRKPPPSMLGGAVGSVKKLLTGK